MVYTRERQEAIALYPNKDRFLQFLKKIAKIYKDSQNLSAMELISILNPIIRG